MDSELGFRIIFFSVFTSVVVTRVYFRWRAKRTGEPGWSIGHDAAEREGKSGILLRLLLFFYMLAVVVLYALNPRWLTLFAVSLPLWSRWLGAGVAVVSLPLLVWVHHALGRQWSANLELRKEHTLITNGPYCSVRHPMYTALLGLSLGIALVSASWPIILLAVATLLLLVARIGKEQTMMIERFGDEYREYMRRTGRLLPRVRRHHAEESHGTQHAPGPDATD